MITGLKLSKDDEGSTVDRMLFKRLVGSLMYLIATRPNIIYGVTCMISRFMDSPKDSHWQAGKRILRYVSGTKGLGIMYSISENFKLIGYTNNDNGGSIDDRKSTSGYTFHFGTRFLSWDPKKQHIITLSLEKSEYVVATSVVCQAVWMQRMLKDMSQNQQESTTNYCDNSSTIALSKNHIFHNIMKHIDSIYHFIRELIKIKKSF